MSTTTTYASPTLERPAMWRRSAKLVAVVASIMTVVLCWMVWDRASLLRNGREIVLQVTPVDPRSLFRGDYVILGYPFARVPLPDNGGKPIAGGVPVYVTLVPEADGSWKVAGTSLKHPGKPKDNGVVLQGRTQQSWWQPSAGTIALRYGIESFFVPEGAGRDLEKLVREKKIAARVAVDAKGRAALKGLMADGQPVYDVGVW